MNKLAIYCAGGLGREILEIVDMELQNEWSEIIFIDDVTDQKSIAGREVLSFDDFLNSTYRNEEIEFVIANGDPMYRKIIFDRLEAHHLSLGNVISRSSIVPASVNIGRGSIVRFRSIFSSCSAIGINAFIGATVLIGHNVAIGDHSVINSHVCVGGWCEIGRNTFIGVNASIRDRVKIGSNCIIGMGSVVLKDVEDNMVVAGNPAKFLRMNDLSPIFKKR